MEISCECLHFPDCLINDFRNLFVWLQTSFWLSCELYVGWLSYLLFPSVPTQHTGFTWGAPGPGTYNQALCLSFLTWKMGIIKIPSLMGLLWKSSETEHVKSLEQCRAHSEHSVTISSHGYSFLKSVTLTKFPGTAFRPPDTVTCGKKTRGKTCATLHILLRL